MVVVNEHDNHDRQRLDSSLVYTGAHNVYYVKSCLSDAKCFSGSRYSFRVQELKPLLFHNWPVHGELQLAIISRIKMFYRPTNLAMAPEEAPAMLRFRRSGSKLTLINPTPYFITVTNMKAGNSNLPNTMVPPKGEVSVDITHAATGDISFQTINDYGALTPRIKATMQ